MKGTLQDNLRGAFFVGGAPAIVLAHLLNKCSAWLNIRTSVNICSASPLASHHKDNPLSRETLENRL